MHLLAHMASRCRICLYFSFRFWRLWAWSLNGSQPNLDTYSLITAMWKFGPNLISRAFTGHNIRAGGKNAFCGNNFELWPNISLQRKSISTIGMKLVNRDSPTCPPHLEDYSNLFRRIYGGKNSAADSASRIFLSADRLFGGQNSAANSDMRRWLGGLIQPLKRFTFWSISNLVSWCTTM